MRRTLLLTSASVLIAGAHYGLMVLLLAGVAAGDSGDSVPQSWRWAWVVWTPEIVIVVGLAVALLIRGTRRGSSTLVWGIALTVAFVLGTLVMPVLAAADHRFLSAVPI